jgi:hypothetical protein
MADAEPPPHPPSSGPVIILRVKGHWTAFWSQPYLSFTLLLGGLVWILALCSTFTYWYIFSSVELSSGTKAGGFYLAQAWACNTVAQGRTAWQPAKSCSQYDLAVGPLNFDYLRVAGGASLAFIILALFTIGFANFIVHGRRTGSIVDELAVCYKQHPSLPVIIARAPFVLHCVGLLWLFFAWVIYVGMAASG